MLASPHSHSSQLNDLPNNLIVVRVIHYYLFTNKTVNEENDYN